MKIIETTKQVWSDSKVCKFLAIGGGVSALAHTFVSLPLMNLVESAGQIGGAVLVNEIVKGKESLKQKSKKNVYGHMAKSAFLLVGASVGSVATKFMPLGEVTDQALGTLFTAGGIGLVESGVEIFKRRDKSVALDQAKENNTNSLFSNNKEVESETYVGLRNRGVVATETEQEAALSLTKTFKKR